MSISSTCLLKAFTSADPKSAKNTVKLSVFFVLSGSSQAKASRKMLVKSTPGTEVIRISTFFHALFVFQPAVSIFAIPYSVTYTSFLSCPIVI